MELLQAFPTLYQPARAGQMKEWTISVVLRDLPDGKVIPSIRVVYGRVGGNLREDLKDIPEGKNLGKSNATTPAQQAVMAAASVWRKKKDGGYIEDINGPAPRAVPMLAEEYMERRHTAKWPGFSQPKLEGVRCRAIKASKNEMVYLSRKGKRFKTMNHMDKYYLLILNTDEEVDGEIFNPEYSFQELVSYLKNPSAVIRDNALLLHYVYDFPIDDAGFSDRYAELEKRISILEDTFATFPIELVETNEVASHEEFMVLHQQYVERGFEGSIFRNMEGKYTFNYRTNDLLKHKDFMDAEYRIADIIPGEGRNAQTGTFVMYCDKTGLLFNANPKGSWALRNRYLLKKEEYIGKMGTVKFQRFTDAGIPYIPTMVAVRDYE